MSSSTNGSTIQRRTFREPDESLDFQEHGRIDILKMRDGAAGMKAVLEPGWTWSGDEKPLLGNPDSCPSAHTGYCMAGELVVRMVGGDEVRIRAGDFFEIPAGHDAYVPGDVRCEMILFEGPAGE
jgi:mannose-6-phosphate isomerase-like protein (cupin superfamily)